MRAVCAGSGADGAAAHLLTLLSVAPELRRDLDVPSEISAVFMFSREGNAPGWTLRLAHGIVDFLLAAPRRLSVAFCNLDHADPTDLEFISVLQRRAVPERLLVELRPDAGESPPDPLAGARAFVTACGAAAPPEEPRALLLAATDQAMRLAYYAAALEWARRGQSMLDPETAPEEHGKFTRNVLFALLLLDRFAETEAVCEAARAQSSDPALLAHVAYAMAMLNARFYEPARRDYAAARHWIEQSLAFSERLPPSETRAVNRAFLMNTMALVELRQGREATALELIDSALATMRRDAPNRFPLECGILLHNRARLHVAGQRPDDAIADLTRLLAGEPSCSEAYFDRALIQQRRGAHAEALADYDHTIRWSPPYWEPHFNRAQVLTALGRDREAIADYDRVLVLQPSHLETRINRGGLYFAIGDVDAAERDAAEALRLDSGNARALCLRGLLAIARNALAAADRDLSAAIMADPQLADAWANRATVNLRRGNLAAALADIDRAMALREDPDIRHNRGRIADLYNASLNRQSAQP